MFINPIHVLLGYLRTAEEATVAATTATWDTQVIAPSQTQIQISHQAQQTAHKHAECREHGLQLFGSPQRQVAPAAHANTVANYHQQQQQPLGQYRPIKVQYTPIQL